MAVAKENTRSPTHWVVTLTREYGTPLIMLAFGIYYFFGQNEHLQDKIDKSQFAFEVRMNEKINKLEAGLKACEDRNIRILETTIKESTSVSNKLSKQITRIERVIKRDSRY